MDTENGWLFAVQTDTNNGTDAVLRRYNPDGTHIEKSIADIGKQPTALVVFGGYVHVGFYGRGTTAAYALSDLERAATQDITLATGNVGTIRFGVVSLQGLDVLVHLVQQRRGRRPHQGRWHTR